MLDHIVYDEIVYNGCACECFVKITGRVWDDSIPEEVSVEYGQMLANDYALRSKWWSRIKRAWAALRNKDWNTGFEFYDEDSALEFAEKFAQAVWSTFPAKAIDEGDEE